MKKTIKFIFVITFFSMESLSQSAKKNCVLGEKFEKNGQFDLAVEEYSKSIGFEANYVKAIEHRAFCYEKIGQKDLAASDYQRALQLEPREKQFCYHAGRLLFELKNYVEADKLLRRALDIDKSYKEAIEMEIKVLIQLKQFAFGTNITQMYLDYETNAQSYFYHALMFDSLNNVSEAEKFYKISSNANAKFLPSLQGLIYILIRREKFEEAMFNCEKLLKVEPYNENVIFARSLIYAHQKDFENAIIDVTECISINAIPNFYKQRAMYYIEAELLNDAISDYSYILKTNPSDLYTYLNRAEIFERIDDKESAVEDYTKALKLASVGDINNTKIVRAKESLFELKREQNKPLIELYGINIKENKVIVEGRKKRLSIVGIVNDESIIKGITVSSGKIWFTKDTLNPTFTIIFEDVSRLDYVYIRAKDIYDNEQLTYLKIEKIETEKPIIQIEVPFVLGNNIIRIDDERASIYIKGTAIDSSYIESVKLNGVDAIFEANTINPEFSGNVEITNREKIVITVKDIFGNETMQTYDLDRSGVVPSADNPMGNTWIVFVENSLYEDFNILEGPAKDVLAITSALANYKIGKIITKKNMKKAEMDKFFTIELRDDMNRSNVSSLVIWYAGHGKYVNPAGYWIPVDAKIDDEFSFYSINKLRASMQTYSNKLKHILVITDACESGETFMSLTKLFSENEIKCSDPEATKFKSAQVLSSAGFELASDDSKLAKSVASSLNNNVEPCISIDKITKRVIANAVKSGDQKPKFGKIKDVDDEGGTFFFIKN